MSNNNVPGSNQNIDVQVRALTIDPAVTVQYKTKILHKNLVNGVNTLTQEMMSAQNTKYVIKYDYILGEDITMPANCMLEFEGGKILNGNTKYTITTNNTMIKNIEGFCDASLLYGGTLKGLYTVSYEMFGAALDGVTNDYTSIYSCHNFANQYKKNVKVVQNSGTIYMTNSYNYSLFIPVATNTDLSGCKLVINDNNIENAPIYQIANIEWYTDVPAEDLTLIKPLLIKGATKVIPDSLISKYENCHFRLGSSVPAADGGIEAPTTPKPKEEVFSVIAGGIASDGCIYYDYSSDETVHLSYRKISNKDVVFCSPTISVSTTENTNGISTKFQIMTDNSYFIFNNIEYINGVPNTISTGGQLIDVSFSYNIHIKGLSGGNYRSRKEQSNSWGYHYLLNFHYCSNIFIKDIVTYHGWGAIGSQAIKNVFIEYCTLSRWDNHIGQSNLHITNTDFIGNSSPINIGYGIGTIFVSNCTWSCVQTMNHDIETCLISLRSDWGNTFSGDIIVDKVKIDSYRDISLILSNVNSDVTNPVNKTCDINISFTNLSIVAPILKLCAISVTATTNAFTFIISSAVFSNIHCSGKISMGITATGSIYKAFIAKTTIDNLDYKDVNIGEISIEGNAGINILSFINSRCLAASQGKVNIFKAYNCTDVSLGRYAYVYVHNSDIVGYEHWNDDTRTDIEIRKSILTEIIDCTLSPYPGIESSSPYNIYIYYDKGSIVKNTRVSNNCILMPESQITAFDMLDSENKDKYTGTTSERPIGVDISIGCYYFDTTLGKPIYWNGTAWVDATGATV